MNKQTVTIIDYGMGNLRSVQNAFHYLGVRADLSGDPVVVSRADTLILPGVGSFRRAMMAIRGKGIDHAIAEAVHSRDRKILGICLGMQLLGVSSPEDGHTEGLGLIKCKVDEFSELDLVGKKSPHIGFNTVNSSPKSLLFRGLPRAADFYFVHSLRMLPDGVNGLPATCDYGVEFLAAFEKDNILATQFHPEKSQTNGLKLLRNFLSH